MSAEVEDTFAEAFRSIYAEVLITARDRHWLDAAVAAATGNAWSRQVEERAKAEGAVAVVISAAIEAEVAQLQDEEEKAEFLSSLGLTETGLARVIRAGYALLDLITFFTVGPKEARAWTVRHGARAPEAAGVMPSAPSSSAIRSPS